MTKIFDEAAESAEPQQRMWPTFLRRQLPILAAIGIAAYLWKSEPRPISVSTESRESGLVTIVWASYDGKPVFAYLYNKPREFEKVVYRSSSNSRGELRLTHAAADDSLVDIACDAATGPVTIAGIKYDLSRGRTFTIDLQRSGAVEQHDVEVPEPTEPDSAERPYRLDVVNADALKFLVRSNAE